MKVHHLNCGSMDSPGAPVVCHVLLVETDDGLVLVDSGFGLQDCLNPGRIGFSRHLLRPRFDVEETAARQVERLGFRRDDVRHVITTHFDIDHIGGIADFPGATVHTTADEHDWAVVHPDFVSKQRYAQKQWAHGPTFATHAGPGDVWKHGLTGIEVLPGITYVPMPGHTRGHAAVAVDAGERGLLVHAGDAVFDASSYASTSPSGAPLTKIRRIRAFEKAMADDRKKIAGNHAALRRLNDEDGITVLNAHDKRVFDDLASS